jgi:hypothetical protein
VVNGFSFSNEVRRKVDEANSFQEHRSEFHKMKDITEEVGLFLSNPINFNV